VRDARDNVSPATPLGLLATRFFNGLLLVSRHREIVWFNERARRLIGPAAGGTPVTCCQLICANTAPVGRCLSEHVRVHGEVLPEIPLHLSDHRLWVAAAPTWLGDDSVVMEVRQHQHHLQDHPQRHADRERGPHPILEVHSLGRTRVAQGRTDLSGLWLRQRAGQLLKYLVTNRERTVALDEIVDVFWAGRPGGIRSARQAVHLLRGCLQPEREGHGPSPFITSTGGGYAIDRRAVWVDADEFETAARAGLGDDDRGLPPDQAQLHKAVRLYGGEFFEDEAYAEWALPERDRLHDLAATVLRRIVALHREANELDGTGVALQRLADLEPFDLDVQRALIETLLVRGRMSQAVRRAAATSDRFERVFGERPKLPVGRWNQR
jgi:DNA-binding SARP family transcriptional activator